MKASTCCASLSMAVALGIGAAPAADAVPLIANGGFESGFTSWTRADQIGSDGTFFIQSGALSPVNGLPVPPPTEGTNAAMTDAGGPGSHVLYQDFIVPAGSSGTLSFDLYIGNQAFDFFAPPTLDFATTALNQQVRVDILRASADPFSVAAADVLLNIYQSLPGDPLVSGYTTISTDISALLAAHAGETLRLRFAEVDNVFIFNAGVDNVDLLATSVPEPTSVWLFAVALLTLGVMQGRARSRLARA